MSTSLCCSCSSSPIPVGRHVRALSTRHSACRQELLRCRASVTLSLAQWRTALTHTHTHTHTHTDTHTHSRLYGYSVLYARRPGGVTSWGNAACALMSHTCVYDLNRRFILVVQRYKHTEQMTSVGATERCPSFTAARWLSTFTRVLFSGTFWGTYTIRWVLFLLWYFIHPLQHIFEVKYFVFYSTTIIPQPFLRQGFNT